MNNILKFCIEKGILLDKESFDFFSQFDEDTIKDIIEKFSVLKERVINKSSLSKNINKIQNLILDKKIIEKIKVNFGISFEITREKIVEKKQETKENELGNIKILMSVPNFSQKIQPHDFVDYFKARFNEIKNIFKERKELDNIISLNKISNNKQSLSVVGIVSNKIISKNKNIILEIEDLTGRIRVLVNKEKKEAYEKAKNVILDDIICVKGFGDNEIIFANDLLYPDLMLQEKTKLERDEAVAFISDIHVGSANFLEENFLKFIKWLNGEIYDERQKEEAKKIKYLFITGDTVDGVGIFPGQEELLKIKDIKEQYKKLAEFLRMIRKDVKIILCPGQHDGVRVAEPQPPIGKDYASDLYDIQNLILVSNPALIEIKNIEGKKGVKILMYHGASLNSFINEIDILRIENAHKNPTRVVKEVLKRRHLASIHSSVTYIPHNKKDYLVISEVPDIINTADLHRTDIDSYNGVLIVCSSCWQSITPFEEKVGNIPDPCKVPVLNLKTGKVKILDFSDEEKNENRTKNDN
ncbi:MAG: metallophosphoesterase [Candidatus Pacearchaeota archaeon]